MLRNCTIFEASGFNHSNYVNVRKSEIHLSNGYYRFNLPIHNSYRFLLENLKITLSINLKLWDLVKNMFQLFEKRNCHQKSLPKNILKLNLKTYDFLDLQIHQEPFCNQFLFLDVYASGQYHSTYHLSLLTVYNPSTIAV